MLFKRIGYFLATISLLFSTIFSLQAQNTTGKEFWLTFGSNGGWNHTLLDFQIRIVSGEKPTTVTIHFTNLGNSITRNMSAHEVWTYSLDNTQKQATYNNMTYTAVTNYSIRITSNEPVSVYALNFRGTSQDATNILPITALSKEYYHISYETHPPPFTDVDCYAVVATQSNTNLYYDGEWVAALDTGEVYYRFSHGIDMNGVFITTDKPVAFFAVKRNTATPYNVYSSSRLMQQLAPVNTWGKNFFVPSSIFTHDRVRIMASQNNTTITQTGGIVQATLGAQTDLENLQKGQFVELEISDTGCYIVADKPVEVCSYLSGYGLITNISQCWIPAIEQSVAKAQIAPFIPIVHSTLTNHYALVYTLTATKDSTKVSIGGGLSTGLTNGSWIENDAAKMSFYTMPLDNDTASYTFTNPSGLIVLAYARATNSASYYYLAGSAMRELDAYFFANNVHFGDLEENSICDNVVIFRAEIENMGVEMDSIKWYIDGEEYEQAGDSLEWSRHFDIGEYEIRMWVRFENDDTISKTGTLKIKNCEVNASFYKNNVHYLIDTTFCAKDVVFNAEIEDYTEIKWFITKEGIEEEYVFAYNLKQWNKDFETGDYTIRMEVLLQSGEILNIYGTLQMRLLWIKMRNIRY